jgi:hypothetical protein
VLLCIAWEEEDRRERRDLRGCVDRALQHLHELEHVLEELRLAVGDEPSARTSS